MQQFEIVLKGISAENLAEKIANVAGATISAKGNGVNIQVLTENDIEKVLQISKN